MSLNNTRLLPLKNKEFKLFLTTRVFLTIALQIQAVIAGWHIYKLTQDPLSLGLIGLAEAIPALSIALYAGHVADISSKRKILANSIWVLLFCSMGLTLASSELFVFGFSESWSVNAMYLFIFLSGFARGFYAPAGFSFIVQLVQKEQLVTASTLNSSAWQMAAIVGPAIGGALYAWIGITPTFLVVLFFIILALVAMLNIKPKPIASKMGNESIADRLKVGLKFVFNNKVVLSAISLDLF
ncbi:MAG: MFS transporter, partial [Bacteroidia bacterium]